MSNTGSNTVSYERLFPALPLLGGAFAISFDVGYFWGVGINYFNFFSLSEHVVFAVQALPFALIFVVLALFVDSFAEWSMRKIARPSTKNEDDDSAALKERIRKLERRGRWILLVFYASAAVFLPYLWYQESYRNFIIVCIFVILIFVKNLARNTWYTLPGPGLLLIGITGSLLFGDYMGATYVAATHTSETIKFKSGDSSAVRIIRAGERGLLYVDNDKRLVNFVQWSDVQSLSRNADKRSW